MNDFAGLTVMNTGAAGGIGKAIAECFAATGARLALVDMHDPSELASRLGADHKGFVLDLEDAGAIASVVDQIGAAMGIDILINNAGLGIVFPAEEPNFEAWDKTMRINLRDPWLVAAAALPYLKASGRGRVINISSQAGVIAIEEHAAYDASKAGLINLAKVMAVEWAKFGITANAVAPTVVETPMALVGWSGKREKGPEEISLSGALPSLAKSPRRRAASPLRRPESLTGRSQWPMAASASNRSPHF